MPGSGKSSFGKKLAKKLKYDFIDLDKLITKVEEETIESIFKTKGEDYFRQLERKYLLETINCHHTVVSCGGGTPCHHDNINTINQNGLSIYLKVSNLLLTDRIFNSKKVRPMFLGLKKNEIAQKMDDLLKKREPFYVQANHHFSIPEESHQSLLNKASQLVLIVQNSNNVNNV